MKELTIYRHKKFTPWLGERRMCVLGRYTDCEGVWDAWSEVLPVVGIESCFAYHYTHETIRPRIHLYNALSHKDMLKEGWTYKGREHKYLWVIEDGLYIRSVDRTFGHSEVARIVSGPQLDDQEFIEETKKEVESLALGMARGWELFQAELRSGVVA